MLIEDFFAKGRGDKLRRLPPMVAGCTVSRLRLDDLALCCETDGEEEVAGRYLCRGEFAHWRGFRLRKRRLEWLGGRIVAKEAAMRWCGLAHTDRDWQQWQLAVLPTGRPELVAGVGSLPDISISHSHNQAVAMATARRCGIDIQQQRDSVLRVRSRFCQAGEVDLLAARLAALAPLSRLTLLWSAKEAIRKAVVVAPLPAFEEMELTAVRGEADGLMIFECCFQRQRKSLQLEVVVVLDHDFAVALVATESGNQWGEK